VDTFFWHRQFPALDDFDRLAGLISWSLGNCLNCLDNLVTLENLAENNVLAIEMTTFQSARHFREAQGKTNPGVEVVMKNWEPLVSCPALAMLRRPFLECFNLKFSSGNFAP
jgi:hypothetical protein